MNDELVCEMHEVSVCTFCRHPGANVPRPKKPTKPSRVKPIKAKPDPATVRAVQVIEGLWCGECNTPYDDHGFCHHERMERLAVEQREISDWYEASPENHKKQAGFVGMAAIGRATLRAGRSTPAMIGNEAVPLVASAMFDAREQYEMAVKYVPSQNTVADEIPV